MKVVIVRVLDIDVEDGEYSYHQLETNEKYGPFPSLPSMTGHIHDKLLEDIAEAIARQLN